MSNEIKIQLNVAALAAVFASEDAKIELRRGVTENFIDKHIGRFVPKELMQQAEKAAEQHIQNISRDVHKVAEKACLDYFGVTREFGGRIVLGELFSTKARQVADEVLKEIVNEYAQQFRGDPGRANLENRIVERAAQLLRDDEVAALRRRLRRFEDAMKD